MNLVNLVVVQDSTFLQLVAGSIPLGRGNTKIICKQFDHTGFVLERVQVVISMYSMSSKKALL